MCCRRWDGNQLWVILYNYHPDKYLDANLNYSKCSGWIDIQGHCYCDERGEKASTKVKADGNFTQQRAITYSEWPVGMAGRKCVPMGNGLVEHMDGICSWLFNFLGIPLRWADWPLRLSLGLFLMLLWKIFYFLLNIQRSHSVRCRNWDDLSGNMKGTHKGSMCYAEGNSNMKLGKATLATRAPLRSTTTTV